MTYSVIVPPLTVRGLLATATIAGFVLAPLILLVDTALSFVGSHWITLQPGTLHVDTMYSWCAATIAFLVLPFLMGLFFSLLTPRRLWSFLSGAAASGASEIFLLLINLYIHADSRIAMTWLAFIITIATIVVKAMFAGLVVTMIQLSMQQSFVAIREGGEETCITCGYETGSILGTTCPECGAMVTSSHVRMNWPQVLMKFINVHAAWFRLVGAICGVLSAITLLWIVVATDRSAFAQQFHHIGELRIGFVFGSDLSDPDNPIAGRAVIIHPNAGSSDVIWIVYLPTDHRNYPAMQLQVYTELHRGLLGSQYIMPPRRIICNLDRQQAEWAIGHGIPNQLIDDLAHRASVVSAAQSSGTADIYIDPSPYMPRSDK